MCSPQINTTDPLSHPSVRVFTGASWTVADRPPTALLPTMIIIDGAAFFLYSTGGRPRLAQSYHQPALSASLDRRAAQIYMGKSHQF